VVSAIGLAYFSFIDNGVYIDEYSDDSVKAESGENFSKPEMKQNTSFYENGDSVICTVGSGAVESIYYFSDGEVRVSGAINGREVNSIYKDSSVYSWAVLEGEIMSPVRYSGPAARENNLLDFGPVDYDTVCKPWLEVDWSVFQLPETEFEVIVN